MALQAILVFVTATCLVTLMAVFLGSHSYTLGIALLIQAFFVPVALLVVTVYTVKSANRVGMHVLARHYRHQVPGWLWFGFWSVNSLVLAGEAAFILTMAVSDQTAKLLEHAPLICALCSSCAFVAIYVHAKLVPNPGTEKL